MAESASGWEPGDCEDIRESDALKLEEKRLSRRWAVELLQTEVC